MSYNITTIIYIFLMLVVSTIVLPTLFIPKMQFEWLDRRHTSTCKGVAVICILIGHFTGLFAISIARIFTPLGGIGVAMFLIISGYGLSESYKKNQLKGFWRKRLFGFWFPYFLIETIMILAIKHVTFLDYLLDITFIKPIYQYGWYLGYQMIWYIIYFMVMSIPNSRKHAICVFIIISLIMFFTFSEIRAEQSLSFVFGVLLSQRDIKKYLSWKYVLVFLSIGLMFLTVKQIPVVRSSPQFFYNAIQLMIKLPCAIALLGGTFLTRQKFNYGSLGGVGIYAYEIYLVQGWIFPIIEADSMYAIMYIIICIALAAVALHYINKYITGFAFKYF